MPQSPSDATRFTSTGPYAASGSNFASSTPLGSRINIGAGAPANETAQQKIARLRAAAAQAKRGQESSFDKVVRIGRVWADRAHRITAYSLIGFTIISGLIAVAGTTDMVLHNRKRRNEWLAEQKAKEAKEVADAKMARAEGLATEDQILLINQERAREEAAEFKKNRPGIFRRAYRGVFGAPEDTSSSIGAIGTQDTLQRTKEELLGESEDRGVLQAVQDKVEGKRRTGEKVEEKLRPMGGPLDRQAASAASAFSETGSRWSSWIMGR